MTEKDIELIEKTRKVPYTQSGEVDAMIPLADTDEARLKLKLIAEQKYREEEYRVGGMC